jgi:hypothetical protein
MKDEKQKMIEIIAIWDRSGSMQSLVSDAIGGFNSFLERQKKDAPDSRLTLVLFHDYWEIVEDGAKITAVAPLNEKSYVPDRCTALYDTLGDTLKQVTERLEKTAPEARPSKVLVAIFTDGLENASIKYSSKQIQDLIKSSGRFTVGNSFSWRPIKTQSQRASLLVFTVAKPLTFLLPP